MSRWLIYAGGVFTGLALAGAFHVARAGREPVYVTGQDLSIQFDQMKGVSCVVPSGTRLTHTWSASEGFEQFCLSLNLEGADAAAVSRTGQVGTAPYQLVARPDDH